jgi:hypothetical protein
MEKTALYSSPYILTVTKSRRLRWTRHAATCMGEMRNVHKFYLENLEKRDHLEDLGIDRRVILK